MGLYQRAIEWMGKRAARGREKHIIEYRDRVLKHRDNLQMYQGAVYDDVDAIDLGPFSAPIGASMATGVAGKYLGPSYMTSCLITSLGVLAGGLGLALKFMCDYKQIRDGILSEKGLLELHKKCLAKRHFSLEDALTLEDYVIS